MVKKIMDKKIIMFCGLPRSGKTTMCYRLLNDFLRGYIMFDGDAFRQRNAGNWDFSRKGIISNHKDAIRIIRYIQKNGFGAVCAFISPLKEARDMWRKAFGNDLIIIRLVCRDNIRAGRPYFRESKVRFEESESEKFSAIIDTGVQNLEETYKLIKNICREAL